MSSFNYEKALSLEWNGQVFVLTVRKETNLGTDYLYSYDGTTWTKSLDISNSSILTTKSAYNTKWTGSNYAIVGNISTSSGNTILRSADGIKFSSLPSNPGIPLYDLEVNLEYPHTITFPRNTTLALGGVSGDSTKIAYSIDEGVTWTPSVNSSTVFNTTANNALWNGKVWVAVGATTNTIATSVDGNTWIGRGSYIFTTSGYAIAWSNEQVQWVAGGSGTNSIAYSPDGVYWSGIGNTLLSTVYDIKWNGSIWVAAGVPVSGNKSIAYSYDGKSWSLPTQTNLFDIKATKLGWNGSFWIALGNSTAADGSYNIATSNNGIVWNMNYNNSFGLNTNTYNLLSIPKTNISMISVYNNIPSAPTNLSSISTLTTLAISFTPPSQNVDYYTIIAVPTSGATVTNTFNAPATSYTITGLQSGITYTISLTATNSFGTSAAGIITAATGNPPSAPTNLTVSSVTSTSVSISFTQPSGTVTTYSISAVPSSGSTVTQTFNAPATSYTITGLQPGMSHTLSLTAINIYGTSPAATVNNVITQLNTPSNLSVSTVTGNSISISFTQPSGTLTNYSVSSIPFSGTTVTSTFNAPASSYTISGLSDNDYNLSLTASTNFATSSAATLSRIHLNNLSTYTFSRTSASYPLKSFASNANGNTLYTNDSNGNIYVSVNRSASWIQIFSGGPNFSSCACSSDGTIVICGANDGTLRKSTNTGSNWVNYALTNVATAVCAMNENGTLILATGGNQNIVYKSVNSGSFVSAGLSVNNHWTAVAVSSDGNVLLAGGDNLYRSTNGGTNWNLILSNCFTSSCSMSSDGKKMIHTSEPNQDVRISTNSGQNWTTVTPTGGIYWKGCGSNSDGTKLTCIGRSGTLYTSSNSGINWVSQTVDSGFTKFLNGGAMSKDATMIITGDNNGSRGIYNLTASIL